MGTTGTEAGDEDTNSLRYKGTKEVARGLVGPSVQEMVSRLSFPSLWPGMACCFFQWASTLRYLPSCLGKDSEGPSLRPDQAQDHPPSHCDLYEATAPHRLSSLSPALGQEHRGPRGVRWDPQLLWGPQTKKHVPRHGVRDDAG